MKILGYSCNNIFQYIIVLCIYLIYIIPGTIFYIMHGLGIIGNILMKNWGLFWCKILVKKIKNTP